MSGMGKFGDTHAILLAECSCASISFTTHTHTQSHRINSTLTRTHNDSMAAEKQLFRARVGCQEQRIQLWQQSSASKKMAWSRKINGNAVTLVGCSAAVRSNIKMLCTRIAWDACAYLMESMMLYRAVGINAIRCVVLRIVRCEREHLLRRVRFVRLNAMTV